MTSCYLQIITSRTSFTSRIFIKQNTFIDQLGKRLILSALRVDFFLKCAVDVLLEEQSAGKSTIIKLLTGDYSKDINVTVCKKAGELLASMLSPGDKVTILEGVSGTPTSEQRVSGAEKGLKNAGMKIAASRAADSNRNMAVSVMENILTANPDLKGIFAINDEMALGSLRAIKAQNKDIPVIGIDGITEAVKSIKTKGMEATVAQKPYDMTYTGVESVLKVIKGESINKRIDSGFDVITEKNADKTLEELTKLLGE
ncbi:sugar ABC transporter substrate-binding protein [Metabacillus rhizolycopersici]|uniref:Sugar ABC transporter substrate-binding protein n=1 Tax=Metabacillus rhizolycopersici TaxID=2875709 RepID=A0ABS7UUJ7_9BACI|nr:sugar ABC transporter substrate-binding protein [Metabacillus rhizolycopersici]MBZ5751826.1 sugar ABC transporter substrate-binding protein [Metabacillus rhizolycopersici]